MPVPIALSNIIRHMIWRGKGEEKYQMGSYAMTILDQSSTLSATAWSCEVTTWIVWLSSRCSRLSPQQRMTPSPPLTAALVLLATNYAIRSVGIHISPTFRAQTYRIILLKDNSPLRVSQDCPGDPALLQLVDRDFARESSIGPIEYVLRCNLNAWAEVLACKQEVERRRGDDDL